MKRPLLLSLSLTLAAILILVVAGAALKAEGQSAASLSADPGLHHGLAALYPGDEGLAGDSSVVFCDDFETGSTADFLSRWTSMNNQDGQVLELIADSIPGCPGRRSLRITGTKGHDTGGDLWKLLDKGYDQLYARFYCKFAADAPYVHHFVHLGGKTSTARYPEGNAGTRPTGDDRFSTSIDLRIDNAAPPGAWIFYSYWCEMRSWQTVEGVSDGRPSPYYGNVFGPPTEKPEQAKRGQWQCVEIMIKLNDPDSTNGEQAFWVDGKLVDRWAPGSHEGRWVRDYFRVNGTDAYKNGSASADSIPLPFEGYRWRKSPNLKINWFWLEYYLANIFQQDVRPDDPTIPYNGEVARVEFDNVVLATRYIGPIATAVSTGFDYNGDGVKSLADVWSLLRMRAADSQDMRTDYNGDGRLNLRDALELLLTVLKG